MERDMQFKREALEEEVERVRQLRQQCLVLEAQAGALRGERQQVVDSLEDLQIKCMDMENLLDSTDEERAQALEQVEDFRQQVNPRGMGLAGDWGFCGVLRDCGVTRVTGSNWGTCDYWLSTK